MPLSKRTTNDSSQITIEQLTRAYVTIAKVVAKYGDVYLPIFERIHNELEKLKKDEALKSIALKVAEENE